MPECGCVENMDPSTWAGAGVWAGEVAIPGSGRKYAEVTVASERVISVAVRDGQGGPLVKGLSVRGYYSISDDEMNVNFEEIWSGSRWESVQPALAFLVIVNDVLAEPFPDSGTRREWAIDFDRDGAIDETWTLIKQRDVDGAAAASVPESLFRG
jgi:hypothetical protein